MNPDDKSAENWQQPPERPGQSPYYAPQSAPDAEADPSVQLPGDGSSAGSVPDNMPASEIDDNPAVEVDSDYVLRWQASEAASRNKGAVWYLLLGAVVLMLVALAIFVFHSWSFAVLIPVMLVALIIYIRRPPQVIDYTLSRQGLHIGDRLYGYGQFKAFGVVSGSEGHSVILLPRKRFQVSQVIYFPEDVGEPLVDMLAARLPMQDVKLDAIDRLLQALHI